ncbi:MAG: hypothetical protein GXN91_00335 [Epsilonproteobacteria bacterium]|nr:hypothetical protein [Campylobacterota bacterium]
MSIKPDLEALLIQLEYPVNDATLKQMEAIANNTKDFSKFAKHIISLNDELKKIGAAVAMSNSKSYLKIKLPEENSDKVEEFEEIVKHWADKYKIKLEKVEGKNTYYILGQHLD